LSIPIGLFTLRRIATPHPPEIEEHEIALKASNGARLLRFEGKSA
jgi:hypothetical protein